MSNLDLLLRLTEVLFYTFTTLSVLMVIAQFSRFSHWSVRMFDFPVKQLLIAELSTLVILLIMSVAIPSFWLILATVSSFFLLYTIWPYTTLHKAEIKKTEQKGVRSFKVLNANVYMENRDYSLLIDQVKKNDPDCLLLLETDLKWARALEELREIYPYSVQHPLENTYGMLFFSKYKMHDPQVRFLLKSDIPSIRLRLEIAPETFIWFYGVHPEPPSPTESDTSEPRDIELLKIAREIRKLNEPVVLAGDFNDVAWSHTTRLFRRFSGLLDPRIGRGSYSTFNTKSFLLRWPLDHVFLSAHFTINQMKVLPSINSDHFPILIGVELHPERPHLTTRPEPQDVSEVKEKIENEAEHTDVDL